MLRIATWNINGIRSFSQLQFQEALSQIDADIVCLQETKITRDAIDEQTATFEGYTSFFSFSRARSGYSGVATLCRSEMMPVRAEEGLTGQLVPPNCTDSVGCNGSSDMTPERMKLLDSEGRALITQFKLKDGTLLSIINVYCPRADPDRYEERLGFKLDFYQLLEDRAQALRTAGSHVVVLGDLNTSHKPIDHCDPGDLDEFQGNLGRLWMDKIVISKPEEAVDDRLQLLDSFRFLHPETKDSFTCWNTQKNARSTNYGTRIDYLLLTPRLAPSLSTCSILSDVMGSDHCPVRAELKLKVAAAGPPPSLCSRFLFLGRQQKLHSFFTVKPKEQENRQTEQKKASGVRKQTSLVGFLQKRSEVSKQSATPTEVQCDSEVVQAKGLVGAWKGLLTGPKPVPPCDGHNEPCVVRTVRKAGPNLNRQFYCCARGEGHKDNPESRCNFFQWATKK